MRVEMMKVVEEGDEWNEVKGRRERRRVSESEFSLMDTEYPSVGHEKEKEKGLREQKERVLKLEEERKEKELQLEEERKMEEDRMEMERMLEEKEQKKKEKEQRKREKEGSGSESRIAAGWKRPRKMSSEELEVWRRL